MAKPSGYVHGMRIIGLPGEMWCKLTAGLPDLKGRPRIAATGITSGLPEITRRYSVQINASGQSLVFLEVGSDMR